MSQAGLSNLSNRIEWIEQKLLNIPKGLSILDAGAGELPYKKYCNHLNYTSQDFGQYDGKGDNLGAQTGTWDNSKLDIVSDITNIPVDNSSFDVVLCSEVIEHVPNPLDALKELTRVLKKDGFIILTAPFISATHFAPYHFCTGFSKYFYEKHLKELGFEIIELTQNGNFFESVAQELQILNSFAKKYTNTGLNIFERISRYVILRKLKKLSKLDSNSKEYLCYGYHVLAKKII
jgi:ubiquinone/menaquinone biosynthesis C-methylase UbiE